MIRLASLFESLKKINLFNNKPPINTNFRLVKWGGFTQSVQSDENFIEFIDHNNELWYQRFSFRFTTLNEFKDLEHELKTLHLVLFEFDLYSKDKINFYSKTGHYLSVRNVVNSTNEVWSIKTISEKYVMHPLGKLYQDVLIYREG
jgi:hypothetical protein